MKQIISFAASLELKNRPDAHLLLTKPCERGFDIGVISFHSRAALEAFNKKANLNAVVKTQVPMNCVLYKHQSDSDARADFEAQKAVACIGNDFVDENGARVTSIQLVACGRGAAIATADFEDGKLTRQIATDAVERTCLGKFIEDCKTLLENSIPVTFRKTELPA